MRKIVLASASPRRSELLKQLGLVFDILIPDLEENLDTALKPEVLAQKLASEKCAFAMDKLDDNGVTPVVVISADTLVVKNGVLGKPADPDDAYRMLKMLQGSWHEVLTGVCVAGLPEKKTVTGVGSTRVRMGDMDDLAIRAYIKTGEPFDKAGAYGVQGFGSLLVEEIEGCYFNIVGLPIPMLFRMLEDFGIGLLSWRP